MLAWQEQVINPYCWALKEKSDADTRGRITETLYLKSKVKI